MSDSNGQWDWEGAGDTSITPAPDSWQAAALRGQLATHIGNALSDAWSNRPSWGQVPGAIANFITGPARQVVGAADRLLHEPVANQLQDKYAQHQLTQGVVGIGAGSAFAPAEGASLRMFGGPLSREAPLSDLAEAQHIRSLDPNISSYDPGDVWRSTGWENAPGGNWRYEISDDKAKLKWPNASTRTMTVIGAYDKDTGKFARTQEPYLPGLSFTGTYKLGDILDHPELYRSYPQLRDMPVVPTSIGEVLGGTQAAYDPHSGTIRLGSGTEDQILGSTLHEVQHVVQHIEGFPRGGSPSEFMRPGLTADLGDAHNEIKPFEDRIMKAGLNIYTLGGTLESLRKDPSLIRMPYNRKVMDQATAAGFDPDFYNGYLAARDKLQGLMTERDAATDEYFKLAGEVEARTTEARRKYGAWQRGTEAPWQTEIQNPVSYKLIRHEDVPLPSHLEFPQP